MATWETDKAKSNLDVSSSINSTISSRDSARTTSSSSNSLSGYSVVGINVESVESMRDAIRNWVTELQTHLDGIDPTADASNAYRSSDGQVEQAVSAYIENCKTYCKNLMSELLVFSDKLADVKNAWVQTTGNLSGTITSDTQATDSGSAYTETQK